MPNCSGNFIKRLNKIKNWLKENPNKYIKIIPQIRCKNRTELDSFLDEVVSKGGEGVIIKDSSKLYQRCRTSYTLKVKKAYDMEGVIVGYNYRDNSKIVKSLIIELANGVIFNLGGGLSTQDRVTPPKIGKTITFKYYGFTKNQKPKFASFLRIREKE